MKQSLAPDVPLAAPEARVESAARGGRGAQGGPLRRVVPVRVALQTGGVLLLGALVVSTALIFVLALAFSLPVELARWAFLADPGAPAWDAVGFLPLLGMSALGGLVAAPLACLLFAADLRRQGWL